MHQSDPSGPTQRVRRSTLRVGVALAAMAVLASACSGSPPAVSEPSAPEPPAAEQPAAEQPLTSDSPVDSVEPDVAGQIVGGAWASVAEFPWMTGILDRSVADPYQAQFCGGVRVSQTKVLTAAHCVVRDGVTGPASAFDILYGTSTLSFGAGTRAQVTGVAVHPFYSEASSRNDLAVLTVAAPPSAAPTIEVVTPESDNNTAPGRIAKLAGWGCSDLEPNVYGNCTSYPELLRRADLPIHSTWYCDAAIPGFDEATMLCAGTVSRLGTADDACYGDSGGPLSVAGARGPLVVGLVSFGPGCGGAPTAYTRLAVYGSWLASNGVPLRSAPFAPASLSPQVRGSYQPLTGDFNGDGRSDVYWYAPGAATDSLWLGSPSGPVPGPPTRQVYGTYRPVVGDVDADGDDDLFWYAPGRGAETLWRGSPSGSFSSEPGRPVNGTYLPVVGDFDATQGDDIYWYAPGRATDALWLSNPADPTSFTSTGARQVNGVYTPASGNFDGTAGDDIYWYAPGGGADYLWRSSPSGPAPGPSVLQLNGYYQLLAGDYDGDGSTDLFGYGAGSGMDLIWRGAPGGFDRQTDVMVRGVYRPAVGDMDGDRRDDVLWHGPGSAPDSWFAGVTVP